MSEIEFKAWPKIKRYNTPYVVTEKIDGTNACVIITEDGQVAAQSRNRLITPQDDNYGFALWVEQNRDSLLDVLNPGYHFGEWWGVGINRGYGLHERRFSLFNVSLWKPTPPDPYPPEHYYAEMFTIFYEGGQPMLGPCHFVPPIGWGADMGSFDLYVMEATMREMGSVAAQGFKDPEGFMVWHQHSGTYLKHPFSKGNE